jgi:mercuric ion transport protein
LALTVMDVPIPRRAENSPIQASSWLAGLGGVAGFGALAASSCCVLPLALAGLGAGSAVFGGLEVLANWRPLLLGGAVVVVLVGWTLFFGDDQPLPALTVHVPFTLARKARAFT